MGKLSLAQKIIVYAFFIIPLLISPGLTQDPINIVKFTTLVICAFYTFFCALRVTKKIHMKAMIIYLIIFFGFILNSLFLSNAKLLPQIYGTYGRNMGALTYTSLFFFSLALILLYSSILEKSLVVSCFLSSSLICTYGLLQSIGIELFDWEILYIGAFSTLGNPNFFSAHAGIVFAMCIALMVGFWKPNNQISHSLRKLVYILTPISLLSVIVSNSDQGFAIVILGVLFALLQLRKNIKPHFRRNLNILITLFGTFIFIFVSFGLKTFTDFLFTRISNSLSVRIEYWRAGISMILEKPLTGFGFDQFGDWYPKFRSDNAYFGADKGEFTDSSHNYLIDLGVSGGLPMVSTAIILIIVITLIGFKIYRNESDYFFNAIFVGWLGFLLQSLVSVPTISISIWGFGFGGIILGRKKSLDQRYQKNRISAKQNRLEGVAIIGIAIACAFPLAIKDFQFLQTKNSNEVLAFSKVPSTFPELPHYYRRAIETLAKAKYFGPSSKLSVEAFAKFPSNWQLTNTISQYSQALDSNFLKGVEIRLQVLNPSR